MKETPPAVGNNHHAKYDTIVGNDWGGEAVAAVGATKGSIWLQWQKSSIRRAQRKEDRVDYSPCKALRSPYKLAQPTRRELALGVLDYGDSDQGTKGLDCLDRAMRV